MRSLEVENGLFSAKKMVIIRQRKRSNNDKNKTKQIITGLLAYCSYICVAFGFMILRLIARSDWDAIQCTLLCAHDAALV